MICESLHSLPTQRPIQGPGQGRRQGAQGWGQGLWLESYELGLRPADPGSRTLVPGPCPSPHPRSQLVYPKPWSPGPDPCSLLKSGSPECESTFMHSPSDLCVPALSSPDDGLTDPGFPAKLNICSPLSGELLHNCEVWVVFL